MRCSPSSTSTSTSTLRQRGGAAALALCAAALLPPAQAQQPRLEKVVVRAQASFGFDQAGISATDRQALLAEVGRMQGVSWQTVTATGHTDSVGALPYNQQLAARRAAAVKAALVGQGLPPALVQTQARGSAEPVADNTSEAGRARNRRAEVVFEGVRSSGP
jgi:OOP family OmpA-OmpF porin